MNDFEQNNWAANELRDRFFGETNPLGLQPDKLTALRNRLDELDRQVKQLKSRLSESGPSQIDRDNLAITIQECGSRKVNALIDAIGDCATTMLKSREGVLGNPICESLGPMTNQQALSDADREHKELNRMKERLNKFQAV
jgi:hypothetical protein